MAVLRTELLPAKKSPATILAVFVHGWASSSKRLQEVISLYREQITNAHCAVVDHNGGRHFSKEPPEIIADRIAQQIQYLCDDAAAKNAPYQKIVLIGHSAGALLLRKAYAFANGYLDDSLAKTAYPWGTKVDRIISLAGIDRGLTFTQKTANMSTLRYVEQRIAYEFTRFFRTATFIRSLQRGEPFVVNLRIQWIRMIQDPKLTVAPTFHLVGDRDDLISRDDSIEEFLHSPNYIYQTVIGADHESILWPTESPFVRRELLSAYTSSPNRSNSLAPVTMTDVFYVLHGVGDLGTKWTPNVCTAIREVIKSDTEKRELRTVRSSYGYFSMLSFLFSWDRQRNVRWFMDLYTQMVARYPNAAHHFVGHSNGTYVLAASLQRYATCKVKNVVFAGSVVPSAFDWTKYFTEKRVSYVRNDVGSRDWIVGIFPHLFEFLSSILSKFDLNAPRLLDLGAAGFNGFFDDMVSNTFYLAGAHNAALNQANFASMARSVVFGRDSEPGGKKVQNKNLLITLLSQCAWLVLPATAALIYGDVLAWEANWRLGTACTLALILLMYTI